MITQDSLVLPRRRCRWSESRRRRWREGSGTARLLGGREAAIGGGGIPRRGNGKPRPHQGLTSGLPARFRHASAEPARDRLQFPDRHPERKHHRAGTNSHHTGDEPIASRPAKTRPIPATNITNIIELTLSRAQNARKPPRATIPSYCLHRQPPIPPRVPHQRRCDAGFRSQAIVPPFRFRSAHRP